MKLMNYYNEHDPAAAAWLRELVRSGQIPQGEVDERDIQDIHPNELRRFTQCHFFAGIGGWPLALRLAGWPEDRPVWTGSCPCQPFSAAGKGDGFADERHLWPAFHHLIKECRPPVVFGEQVASKDGFHWLDLVRADLEGTGYAFGASDLCAAGIGAPHIRQRIYFVGMADANRWEFDRIPDGEGCQPNRTPSGREQGHGEPQCGGGNGWMADADGSGSIPRQRDDPGSRHRYPAAAACGSDQLEPARPPDSHWSTPDWLLCRDGKWRPVESGTFPLAHRLPKGMVRSGDPGLPFHPQEARVMRLRGYGNAIVPQLAAEFIKAIQ